MIKSKDQRIKGPGLLWINGQRHQQNQVKKSPSCSASAANLSSRASEDEPVDHEDLSVPEDGARRLVVVPDRQHQRDEAAQHQSQDLHLAQSFAPAPSGCGVAVASAPDLREDVHGGHVEEGAGRKEHGDAGGVDV